MIQKGKNILLLIPNLDYGGAQRSFVNLLNNLEAHYKVYPYVYTDPPSPYPGHIIKPVIPLTKNTRGIFKILKFARIFLKLFRLKKELNIDVSISFMESANYFNVCTRRGEKVIISHRGSYLNDGELRSRLPNLRLKLLMPLIFKNAQLNVCVSTNLMEEIIETQKIPRNRCTTIYNFYNTKNLQAKSLEPLAEHLKFLKNTKYLVTVGRLHSQKGFSNLLELYDFARKRGLNHKLVIVGSGEDEDSLYRLCTALNLTYSPIGKIDIDSDVLFLGYSSNPLLIIRGASLFLLTSFWEGFPNVVIEAMASETLVLASDCPTGPREIMNYSNDKPIQGAEITDYGVLLPMLNARDNYDAWISQILTYCQESKDKTRIISNAIDRLNDFSEMEIMKQWHSAIDG